MARKTFSGVSASGIGISNVNFNQNFNSAFSDYNVADISGVGAISGVTTNPSVFSETVQTGIYSFTADEANVLTTKFNDVLEQYNTLYEQYSAITDAISQSKDTTNSIQTINTDYKAETFQPMSEYSTNVSDTLIVQNIDQYNNLVTALKDLTSAFNDAAVIYNNLTDKPTIAQIGLYGNIEAQKKPDDTDFITIGDGPWIPIVNIDDFNKGGTTTTTTIQDEGKGKPDENTEIVITTPIYTSNKDVYVSIKKQLEGKFCIVRCKNTKYNQEFYDKVTVMRVISDSYYEPLVPDTSRSYMEDGVINYNPVWFDSIDRINKNNMWIVKDKGATLVLQNTSQQKIEKNKKYRYLYRKYLYKDTKDGNKEKIQIWKCRLLQTDGTFLNVSTTATDATNFSTSVFLFIDNLYGYVQRVIPYGWGSSGLKTPTLYDDSSLPLTYHVIHKDLNESGEIIYKYLKDENNKTAYDYVKFTKNFVKIFTEGLTENDPDTWNVIKTEWDPLDGLYISKYISRNKQPGEAGYSSSTPQGLHWIWAAKIDKELKYYRFIVKRSSPDDAKIFMTEKGSFY